MILSESLATHPWSQPPALTYGGQRLCCRAVRASSGKLPTLPERRSPVDRRSSPETIAAHLDAFNQRLDRLEKQSDRVEEKVDDLRVTIVPSIHSALVELKVRSGVWGALAGAIPVLILAIGWLVFG